MGKGGETPHRLGMVPRAQLNRYDARANSSFKTNFIAEEYAGFDKKRSPQIPIVFAHDRLFAGIAGRRGTVFETTIEAAPT